MVFDPTFHEISEDADELPDLDGSAQAPPLEGDIEEDELPPYGGE